MSYTPAIEGLEGQKTEVQVSFWTGPKLLINGQPAAKGKKRGEMVLTRNDGTTMTATWKPQGMDVPQLVVDGKVHNLVEPLKWYQWLWGGLPILLLFVGGALGAIVGVIGFSISARVFRMNLNGALKYLLVGVVTVLSIVVWFVAALLVNQLLRG